MHPNQLFEILIEKEAVVAAEQAVSEEHHSSFLRPDFHPMGILTTNHDIFESSWLKDPYFVAIG